MVNRRHRGATRSCGRSGPSETRAGLQGRFLPVPGGVFGDGVVFAGILVALAGPFWPGGAAPRGVAILVPVLVSAPCKPKHGRVVFTTGKGHWDLESMPLKITLIQNEATSGVTLCPHDATNVSYNHKGLLGTQTHSPTRTPGAPSPVSSGRDVHVSAQREPCYVWQERQWS